MANIKQAQRRVRQNERRWAHNIKFKSSMRTAIKRFNSLVDEQNVEEAKEAYNMAFKRIDKAVSKGVIHQNKGSRVKANLSKKMKQASA